MRVSFKRLFAALAMARALTSVSLPTCSRAQTYPIDCAILFCLSGSWPVGSMRAGTRRTDRSFDAIFRTDDMRSGQGF
jgi:hypothetical protein